MIGFSMWAAGIDNDNQSNVIILFRQSGNFVCFHMSFLAHHFSSQYL